jgi:hypothetical protein
MLERPRWLAARSAEPRLLPDIAVERALLVAPADGVGRAGVETSRETEGCAAGRAAVSARAGRCADSRGPANSGLSSGAFIGPVTSGLSAPA